MPEITSNENTKLDDLKLLNIPEDLTEEKVEDEIIEVAGVKLTYRPQDFGKKMEYMMAIACALKNDSEVVGLLGCFLPNVKHQLGNLSASDFMAISSTVMQKIQEDTIVLGTQPTS